MIRGYPGERLFEAILHGRRRQPLPIEPPKGLGSFKKPLSRIPSDQVYNPERLASLDFYGHQSSFVINYYL